MPGEFTEVPAPVERNCLGAWGGWLGEGVGGVVDASGNVTELGSLFVATGSRAPGGGGSSRVFRLDRPDGTWEDDHAPSGAETIRKMRSGIDPHTREWRLWAFFESPHGAGQTWLAWRLALSGPSPWHFEQVPMGGGDVGGEGLGVPLGGGADEPQLFAGASQNWDQPENREGLVCQKQPDGSFSVIRRIGPAYGHHVTLMWAVEFDALGRHWQHWNDFGQAGAESGTFINNQAGTPPAPGGDVSSLAWFDGWMYTCGALQADPNNRSGIFRIQNGWGTNWEGIHRLQIGIMSDHLLRVPRGEPPGELWVVGHAPLEAAYTLDGSTWTRDLTLPAISTGDDTNALTAIAYYDGSVWIVSRDSSQGTLRAWRDKPLKGTKRALSGQIV
jgi:hypothetical protein